MNIQSHSIESIARDDTLVFDFFAKFSRFECALKRAEFVKRERSGRASPDWNKFADTHGKKLATITDADFESAKSFLLRHPPQKQMFVAPHSMQWEPNSKGAKESDARYLLRLVRDVRNNLFHGGKYPDSMGGPITDDWLRNAELLRACLTILCKALSLDAKIKHYFADKA